MANKHVTIILTLEQAIEVKRTLESQRNMLVHMAALRHTFEEEQVEFNRSIALLSDSLLEF